MEEIGVIELEGTPENPWKGKTMTPWKVRRTEARANLLWTYLNLHSDRTRFSQSELSEVLALGTNRVHLREATKNLESRGLLEVDRAVRPNRYTLIETETQETA